MVELDHRRHAAARCRAVRDRRAVLPDLHRRGRDRRRPHRHARYRFPVWMQWLLFAALSIAAMLTIRRQLYAALRKRPLAKSTATPINASGSRKSSHRASRCRVEYRGSGWTALNVGERLDPRRRGSADRVRRRSSRCASAQPTFRPSHLNRPFGAAMTQTAFLAALAIAIVVIIVLRKTAIVVPQQSAFIVELLGKYSRTLSGGLPHPGAVHRAHRVPAQPEGAGARHPGADLHHERQRAGRHRRRALPAGARRRARVVRHRELRLRDLAARADHAAQRDRQDRARPHVRGARRRSTPTS